MFFDSTADDRRQYSAADFAGFMKTFYATGIIAGGDKLKAVKDSDLLAVSVTPGHAMIEGHWYYNSDVLFLALPAADVTYSRIDRVVLRLDLSLDVRKISLQILKGTPAASPAPPDLTRNENIYEISLAQLTVPANAITITAIKDERDNAEVCGLCQGLYSVDMQEFTAKLESFLESAERKAQEAADSITNMGKAAFLEMLLSVGGAGSDIDADKLDGQHGSFYLNYQNLNNKPTLNSLGGQSKILSGQDPPAASLGADGDVYIQYS